MDSMGIKMMRLRFENNLTIKEVAEKLGISPRTYSNYEKGRNHIPLKTFMDICLLYHVSADDLLGLKQ